MRQVATIAVDFDGVLHAYSKGWHDGTAYDVPLPGAIEGLKALMEDYAVFIFSTRPWTDIDLWLSKHVPEIKCRNVSLTEKFWNEKGVLGITDRKLPAMVYIDDRAFQFKDWEGVKERAADFPRWPLPGRDLEGQLAAAHQALSDQNAKRNELEQMVEDFRDRAEAWHAVFGAFVKTKEYEESDIKADDTGIRHMLRGIALMQKKIADAPEDSNRIDKMQNLIWPYSLPPMRAVTGWEWRVVAVGSLGKLPPKDLRQAIDATDVSAI